MLERKNALRAQVCQIQLKNVRWYLDNLVEYKLQLSKPVFYNVHQIIIQIISKRFLGISWFEKNFF